MSNILPASPKTLMPTPEDTRLAISSSRVIAQLIETDEQTLTVSISGSKGDHSESITLPASALRFLGQMLSEMAKGNAVTLIPTHAELTTQQAAELLGVSRPFLIEQLEKSELSHRKVGSHRRVLFSELMRYKETMDRKRLESLDELAAQAQELNMGY